MLEVFNWIVNLFLNTPVQIIVLVLGAAGVSILSQVLKKWWKIENERWMFLLVTGIAFAGSFLDWFLHSSTLPVSIVGIQTSVLIGIAQPIYFYVVKPINLIISGYRANKKLIEEKLNELGKTPAPTTVNTLEDSQRVISAAGVNIPTPTPQAAPATAEGARIATPFEETPVAEPPRPVATF